MGNCACGAAGNKEPRFLKEQKKQVPVTIADLFESYAGKKGVLSVQDLQQVLIDQRVNNSEAHARQLIVKHRKEAASAGEGALELELPGFASLLFDTDVNAVQDGGKVTHNMHQPLPQYFIQSASNAAELAGGPVASTIFEALKTGARVVDLEARAVGVEVQVSSGGRTAPVHDLLTAVKEGAFLSSEFPVILVIENHLSPALQDLLAQHLKDILGESLFVPPSGTRGIDLSPSELKRRVIIAEAAVEKAPNEAGSAVVTPNSVLPPAEASFSDLDDLRILDTRVGGEQISAALPDQAGSDGKGSFASLVSIRGLKASEPIHYADKAGTLASPSEASFSRLASSAPSVLAKYVTSNLIRVSASDEEAGFAGAMKAWSYGAQIAASDSKLWLQRGFFSANGGCGYVLKPDILKPGPSMGAANGAAFDPLAKKPVKTTLKIMIVWSQVDQTATRPDTFVRIATHGLPADQGTYDTTTRVNDGKPAAWESEEFHFPLTVPELALLAIEVRQYNSQQQDLLACRACLPVAELRPGLRAVAMSDARGIPLPDGQARLLVHVELSPANDAPPPPGGAAVAPGSYGVAPPGGAPPSGGAPQSAASGPPPQVVHTRYQETVIHERRRSPVAPFLGGMLVGRMLAPRPRQQVMVVNNKAAPAPRVVNANVNVNKTARYSGRGGASYARPAPAARAAGARASAGASVRASAASYSAARPARGGGGGRMRRRR